METTAGIEIDRPAPEVFAFVSDMANNTAWQKGQVRCEWTSEPPHGLGSTYDQEARFLGRDIVSTFEVTEFDDGSGSDGAADRPARIRIRSTSGTMPIDVTRTVTPRPGGGCRVEAVVRGDPPMPMKLLGPLMTVMVRRSVAGDYRRLRVLLEES